jgi:hypothetical protein
MSLHALANHLQQAGRGDDKVLIHMTPKEVKGLQSLAMAHGGSLTINPETGLPEAGFLSRLLPTIIGAGLTIASGGALSPLMAAGITGAGYGIAKGSLREGLMAGLGAYGGAGLASGLTAAGAAAPTAGSGASYGSWAASDAGKLAGQQALDAAKATATGTGSAVVDTATNALQPLSSASPFASTQGFNASTYGLPGGGFAPNTMPPPVDASAMVAKVAPPQSVFTGGVPSGVESASMRQAALDKATTNSIAAQQKLGISSGTPTTMDNLKAGFSKGTGSWEGAKEVWDATPTGTGYGLAATAMGLAQEAQNKGTGAPAASDSYLRPYDYSVSQNESAYAPNASTSERMYFDQPRFIARPIQKLAVGGMPEREAAYQSVSMNDTYPMAQLNTPMYSDPSMQRPMAREVINPSGDVGVDDFTGEARMASGGVANPESTERKYSYNPETMKFTALNTPAAAPASKSFFGLMGLNPTFAMTGLGSPFSRQNNATPQPTVAAETTGGIAKPYIPEGQAEGMRNTSMVPNIQLQELRTPEQQLGLEGFYDSMNQRLAQQGGYAGYAAGGGISTLGGYSDGGRLLRGPGDGVSDSIPASIGSGQPARLADGEFVVPARIVSEIGNGSTEAGARKLYKMMERVQHARRKTVGKNQVAKNTKAERLLPA